MGIDQKLMKKETGHRSASVDAYQIKSDKQHAAMSKIIAQPPSAPRKKKKMKIRTK